MKNLCCPVLLVLALLVPFASLAQEGMTIDYGLYLNLVRDIARSTVYVETPHGHGTGVVFAAPITDTGNAAIAFVVTAKHVLAIGDPDTATKWYDTASVIFNLKAGGTEKRRYVQAIWSKTRDLIVLRPIDSKRPFRQYDVPDATFGPGTFAKPDSIELGQYAFLAGFPLEIGTSSAVFRPVIQSGIVAQVSHDSDLIDIHVNKGNSGGGAFTIMRDGTVKILGLVVAYQLAHELVVKKLVLDQKSRITNMEFEKTNSALGKVVPIWPLHQYVGQLLTAHKRIVIE